MVLLRVSDVQEPTNIVTILGVRRDHGTMVFLIKPSTQEHVLINLTEYLKWDSTVLLMIVLTIVLHILVKCSLVLTTHQPVIAGILVTSQDPTAQPAQILHTSTAHIQIIVYILNLDVMVILNVNMGRMRILMCARSSIKKTR